MIAYSYDPETKLLDGIVQCQESPLEPGIYLLPANATFKVPIASKEKEVLLFNTNTNKWEVVPDFRGEVWLHPETGKEIEVIEIGIPKDLVKELSAETIAKLKAEEDAAKAAKEAEDTKQAWDRLRGRRNGLLLEADHIQLPTAVYLGQDKLVSDEDKQACAVYMQKLRDLPKNTSDPFNVIWPEKPFPF